MHISEINIYPVKSLGGITMDSAVVEDRGLRFDRRWMLVDDKRQFLTQREFPMMSTLKVTAGDEGITVSSGQTSIYIPADPEGTLTINVKIWSSSVKAKVYDDTVNTWFADALGTSCRLVMMPDESKRKVNPFYSVRKFKDTVSFADGYPFMLIGQGSLDDLNSRLATPVPMNRFRPNFVVEGSEPFAEDSWKKIRIGSTVFHVVKPCARCIMPTIDQSTGKKTGKEPLHTLSVFRKTNGNVLFGQNLIADAAGGTVAIGDAIEVLEVRV